MIMLGLNTSHGVTAAHFRLLLLPLNLKMITPPLLKNSSVAKIRIHFYLDVVVFFCL